jgi:hypothetical protein
MPASSKLRLPVRFSDWNVLCISHLSVWARPWPAHVILLDLLTLIMFYKDHTLRMSWLWTFVLHRLVCLLSGLAAANVSKNSLHHLVAHTAYFGVLTNLTQSSSSSQCEISCSHGGENEDDSFLRFNAVQSRGSFRRFRPIIAPHHEGNTHL